MRRLACLVLLALVGLPVTTASAHSTHGADPVAIDGQVAAAGGARAANASVSPWCGEERASDDREHEVDNGAFRYHAIYAVPADSPARLRNVAGTIQADALGASALLERLYGRAIRYDMGTACGPGHLDITTLRLPMTRAELEGLARTGSGVIDAVSRALAEAGFATVSPEDGPREEAGRTRNFAVWLDGPGPANSCGQATLYNDARRDSSNANNHGGKVALIYRRGAGFCGAETVRHEIAHNLGALQAGAPHAFDGAHCNDAYEDTMCYPTAPRKGDGVHQARYFDYGNDDYWDPPTGPQLGHWTVNLSRFICPDATCNGIRQASVPTVARAPVSSKARKRGTRWYVSARLGGAGRASVAVRCRRRPGASASIVVRRTVSAPATFRASVSCSSRPKVTAIRA